MLAGASANFNACDPRRGSVLRAKEAEAAAAGGNCGGRGPLLRGGAGSGHGGGVASCAVWPGRVAAVRGRRGGRRRLMRWWRWGGRHDEEVITRTHTNTEKEKSAKIQVACCEKERRCRPEGCRSGAVDDLHSRTTQRFKVGRGWESRGEKKKSRATNTHSTLKRRMRRYRPPLLFLQLKSFTNTSTSDRIRLSSECRRCFPSKGVVAHTEGFPHQTAAASQDFLEHTPKCPRFLFTPNFFVKSSVLNNQRKNKRR